MTAHLDDLTATVSIIMMLYMRTTVTLDPETERLLREAMRRHGWTFKEALNRAVVHGLTDGDQEDEAFCAPPKVAMGLRGGYDGATMNHLADDLEAEAFRDLTERLQKPAP